MANKLSTLTAAYFDSLGLKYSFAGDNSEIIETGMGGLDNLSSIRILIFFDSDESSAQVVAPQIVKVPANKQDKIYKVLNELNHTYRWVKFYMDNDGYVMVDADCILDMETCGRECFEIIRRIIGISDSAYPVIMKEIWN